jgi:ribonucleoside-diphosphate reductase alpha chain
MRPLGLCPQFLGFKPMSLTIETTRSVDPVQASVSPIVPKQSAEPGYQVIRRNGTVTPFDSSKITIAVTKAFLAVEGNSAAASRRVHDIVAELTQQVVAGLTRRADAGRTFHIEDIQDQVELALMRSEHHKVARAYVLYREEHAKARRVDKDASPTPSLRVRHADGSLRPLNEDHLARHAHEACFGLDGVSADLVLTETHRNLYDGIPLRELAQAVIMAARPLVETEPNYAFVSARLLLDKLRSEALSFVDGSVQQATQTEMATRYTDYFLIYVKRGIALDLLDKELGRFDLNQLATALQPERDLQFQFPGLKTLYDRYFLHSDGVRFELPQAFFMRVAMGLALREVKRE